MALIKGKQIGSQTVTVSGSTGNVVVSGLLDTNGNQVFVNVAPSDDNHLANKAYVDALAQGVRPHAPVNVVSTNDITLSGLQTIDGITLTDSDRVLVAGQTDTTENGIYSASSGAWSRAEDADGTPANEVQLGDFSFIMSGTTNGNSGWVLGKSNTSTSPDIVPGTDTQEWYKMAAPGSYSTDGAGLELTGSQFFLELDGTTLSKSGSGLKLNDAISTAISTNTSNNTSLDTALSVEISSTNSDISSLEEELSTGNGSLETAISVGDDSLDTALSVEISSTNSDISSLEEEISTGNGSLETAISVGDDSLDTALSIEISSTNSDVSSLEEELSTGNGSLETAISVGDDSLDTALSIEISSTNSDVTSLDTAISTGDQSLENALSTLSGDTLDITTILNNGEVLGLSGGELTGFTYSNDFTSLETAISVGDDSLDTALSVEVSTTDSEISSLEEELSTGNGSLETALSTGDASLTTALSVEVSTTDSEISSLEEEISTGNGSLETAISVGDDSLDTALSVEVSTTDSEISSLEEELSTGNGSLETAISVGDDSLDTALSIEISSTNSDVSSLEEEISTGNSSLETAISVGDDSLDTAISIGDDSLTTAIDNINNPEVINESITPDNSGSTSNVVVSTIFAYGTGVVDVDSVTVYLNGIQYPFAYASGSVVFHTNGNTPDGTGDSLYFDGTVAGFGIETDDTVIVKYMVVT